MSKQTKPCDLPCPKCGNEDIHRQFQTKGTQKTRKDLGDYTTRENECVAVGLYTIVAKRDHITHHCRCCQFDWETEPLKENSHA